MANFCGVILSRFLSVDTRGFHRVSQLQASDAGGDIDISVFSLV